MLDVGRRDDGRFDRRQAIDPRKHSRAALLEWSRNHCPDLVVRFGLAGDVRLAYATWTHAGVRYEREAADEEKLARDVVTAIARLFGYAVRIDEAETRELERQVLAATLAGHPETADTLGRELALRNEGHVPRRIVTRFGR